MPRAIDRVCACCGERRQPPFVVSPGGIVCTDCVREGIALLFDRMAADAGANLDREAS